MKVLQELKDEMANVFFQEWRTCCHRSVEKKIPVLFTSFLARSGFKPIRKTRNVFRQALLPCS